MQLDGEFAERVEESELMPQQWSLVMMATEFEIEDPETPAEATLVANTDNLSAVAGEMNRIEQDGIGGMSQGSRKESILGRLADKFKRGATTNVDFDEAESLADEYASRLQRMLVESDRWADVCATAASE
jgi:hypothetical protein